MSANLRLLKCSRNTIQLEFQLIELDRSLKIGSKSKPNDASMTISVKLAEIRRLTEKKR